VKYSLITPTFGRPEEVLEFLDSLKSQQYSDFEVIISDGTPKDTLRPAIQAIQKDLPYPLVILYKEFLPVSDARNWAAEEAKGAWLVFLDSDCIIPPGYLKAVDSHLAQHPLDVFGGPDAAHGDFTPLQKAISHAMTSFLTTGGIRGGERRTDRYYPRGFNMGIRREKFFEVKGYDTQFRCGEDVELSIRLEAAGSVMGLIPKAFVYHKRRTSLQKFFKQVYRFGAARLNLARKHPHQLKLTHLFPVAFSGFGLLSLAAALQGGWYALPLVGLIGYLTAVGIEAYRKERSLTVARLAVVAAVFMFTGYAWGFVRNVWATYIQRTPGGLKL
jgi:GT2 family glycosyltransferase